MMSKRAERKSTLFISYEQNEESKLFELIMLETSREIYRKKGSLLILSVLIDIGDDSLSTLCSHCFFNP